MRRNFGPLGSTRAARASFARLLVVAGLLALVLTVAGPLGAVGQDDASPTGQDEADRPVGVFSVSITRDDVPPGLAGGPTLIGQWSLTLEEDGTYTLARQDVGVVASGTFEVDGATLTLTGDGGLLPCGAGGGDEAAEARYAWEVDGDALTLTPIDEGCEIRRILLGTRTLGGFESCATAPLSLSRPDDEPDATPGADLSSAGGSAVTGSVAIAGQDEAPADAGIEREIDDLLQQVTGCWATGDPARFLPLHTRRVLEEIDETVPLEQFVPQFAPAMQQPLTFERVGDVELVDPTHATAYVVISFGGQELPLQFEFALEDGEWLLDSFFFFELLG